MTVTQEVTKRGIVAFGLKEGDRRLQRKSQGFQKLTYDKHSVTTFVIIMINTNVLSVLLRKKPDSTSRLELF